MLDSGEMVEQKIEYIKNLEFPIVGAKPSKVKSFDWCDYSHHFRLKLSYRNNDGEDMAWVIILNKEFIHDTDISSIYNFIYNSFLNYTNMDRTIIDSPLHKAIYG